MRGTCLKLDSVTLTIGPLEVRQAFLSARMPPGISVSDVVLGRQAVDLYLRVNRALAIPARVRLELLSYSGCKIRFRMRSLTPISPVAQITEEFSRTFPGAADLHGDTLEIDLVQVSQGRINHLEISGMSIEKEGITVTARDLDLKLQWRDILGSQSPITLTG
jgi:hypothetical protein